MIEDHFTETVTLKRKTVTGNKTTFATVGDPFACHIQPMTGQPTPGQMGRGERTFRLFSTEAVRIGDRLTDQNAVEYEVYGVEHHRFRGKQHYQAELRAV